MLRGGAKGTSCRDEPLDRLTDDPTWLEAEEMSLSRVHESRLADAVFLFLFFFFHYSFFHKVYDYKNNGGRTVLSGLAAAVVLPAGSSVCLSVCVGRSKSSLSLPALR